MIDGTYRITINVLFGRKHGKVVLRTDDDVLIADIDVPVVGKQHVTGHVEGDTFKARGAERVPLMGVIRYAIKGKVVDDTLFLDIKSNRGNLKLKGIRV